jgi:hypothetical protein
MQTILRKLIETQLAERLDENLAGLVRAVVESPTGKASASVNVKLSLSNGVLHVKSKLGYGPRYGSEGEDSVKYDPNQIKLPLNRE